MRRILAAIGIAVLVAACGSAAPGSPSPTAAGASPSATTSPSVEPSAAWTDFAPAGEGFSVLLPCEPSKTTSSFQTAVGDAPATMWTCIGGPKLAYVIAHISYPAGSMEGLDPADVFAGAIAGGIGTQADAALVEQSDVTQGGHPGRTFTVETPNGSIQGVIYLVGDDLYLAYATYDPDQAADVAAVAAFAGSFRLTD